MGKKTVGRHLAKPAFRESDFAGRPAQEQADLSGSLNQLSQQLAATRQLLQDIEGSTTVAEAITPGPRPAVVKPAQHNRSDDDTTAASR